MSTSWASYTESVGPQSMTLIVQAAMAMARTVDWMRRSNATGED